MSAVRLIPWALHEALEYLAGVFLILAPFIFGFRDEPAFPVFVAVGVLMLVVNLLTGGRLGVVGVVPAAVHAAMDYVVGLFLIGAPFIFAFTDIDAALFSSLFLGLALFVVSLLTAYPTRPAPAATAATAGAGGAGGQAPAPETSRGTRTSTSAKPPRSVDGGKPVEPGSSARPGEMSPEQSDGANPEQR